MIVAKFIVILKRKILFRDEKKGNCGENLHQDWNWWRENPSYIRSALDNPSHTRARGNTWGSDRRWWKNSGTEDRVPIYKTKWWMRGRIWPCCARERKKISRDGRAISSCEIIVMQKIALLSTMNFFLKNCFYTMLFEQGQVKANKCASLD